MPAHLRTIDPVALEASGAMGVSNEAKISESLNAAHTGPAQILARATGSEQSFAEKIQSLKQSRPALALIGGPDSGFESFISLLPQNRVELDSHVPVISLLLPRNERLTLAEQLSASSNTNVVTLLSIRELRGMIKLHPASHAAGAPYDAGLLTLAQLIESGHIDPAWADQFGNIANQAAVGNQSAIAAVEAMVMATLSLGRQLDFRSLANLAEFTESLDDWANMATLFRALPDQVPALFTILHYEESSQGLFDYLSGSEETEASIQDLILALNYGPQAVSYLLEQALPVYEPTAISKIAVDPIAGYRPEYFTQLSFSNRVAALWLKLTCLLAAGLAFSLAMAAAWRGSSKAARDVGYFTPAILGRDACLSIVFTLIVWFTFEPDMLQSNNNEVDLGPRIEFAVAGALDSIQSPVKTMQDLNQVTLLVLLLFFILQLVIYCFCLIKLKEISKQTLSPDMKIKLLDNEENLFDFGLYVGLGGTVLSLILVAVNIVEASLMAAYASTLFGILFVALLKVMHLRPYRRQLILEAGHSRSSSNDDPNLMGNIKL
ncbi:MAG: hypothetical protein ACPGSB_03785 [Opitutales bacterium]